MNVFCSFKSQGKLLTHVFESKNCAPTQNEKKENQINISKLWEEKSDSWWESWESPTITPLLVYSNWFL